jgi:hypothetical protein
MYVHGIPYINTFIILQNNGLDYYSYFMLVGWPWLKDAKMVHD